MQWAVAAGSPPSLKAMVPIITSAENFTVTHPDGAFGLETRLRWAQGINSMNKMHGRPFQEALRRRFSGDQEEKLQTAYEYRPLLQADEVAAGEAIPLYRDILTHSKEDDPFWTARDHSKAVAGVTAAVHLIGGWYDYYLRGILRDYATLKAAGQSPYLTVGPWHHASPDGMITGLREGISWFEAQLKGLSSGLRAKPVRIFVMGAEEWREFDEFPPAAQETQFYLHAGNELSPQFPASDSSPDRYRYDPDDPTPSVGGAFLGGEGAGAQDNRSLEARSDVLTYSTDPLTEPLEIIGPVYLALYIRSSLEHTDFFGRVCDVDADGRSINICDGLYRVSPGRGASEADGSLRVEIELWPTAHRFQAGHRLRLQISSGAHPRWSRNPGTGEDLATGIKTAVAEQMIFHDVKHPSVLILPVTNSS
jgi:putative CocE/NonD family hydrolase